MFSVFSLPSLGLVLTIVLLYVLSLIIYRLYFHPLAKFPGPKIAACTTLYEFYYDVVKDGQYIWQIKDLHQEYGPIIRISPNDLHIIDADFYEQIYSRHGKWEKSKEYCQQFGNEDSVVFTQAHDLHHMRRVSANPFFSKQKIQQLEPVIRSTIEKLSKRLEISREKGESVPIRLAYESFGTDVITEYCFARSYNCLDDPTYNLSYHDMVLEAGRLGVIGKHVPWLPILLNNLPSWLVLKVNPGFGLFIAFREDSMATVKEVQTRMATNEQAKTSDYGERPTMFHEIISDPLLPPAEKRPWRLGGEAVAFISAGTDTVSHTLHQLTWFLSQPGNAHVLQKLRQELRTVQPDPLNPAPLKSLEQLPYLTAVLLEGLRLSVGVASRLQRVAPDRPIRYQDWVIPPGTPVSIIQALVHFNEDIFPEPDKFDPERWTNPKEKARLDKYMVVFSKGARMCLGLNLAWAELYMTVSTLFTRFDFKAAPHVRYEEHVKFNRDRFFPQPKGESVKFEVFVQ